MYVRILSWLTLTFSTCNRFYPYRWLYFLCDLGVIYINELCKFLPPNRGPLAKILIFLLVLIIVSKGYLHFVSWLVALCCIFCFWIMRKLEPRVDWVREVTRKGRRGNNSGAIFSAIECLDSFVLYKTSVRYSKWISKKFQKSHWQLLVYSSPRERFLKGRICLSNLAPTHPVYSRIQSLDNSASRMDTWLLNLVLCKCTITYPSVRSKVGRISCEGKSLLKFFHIMTFYRNSNNNLYLLHTYLYS